jgi:hypothetical protein
VNNWLVGVLLLAGCAFPVAFGNGSLRCGGGGSCPPDLHCAGDGRCYRAGSGPRADDAGTSDGAIGDVSDLGRSGGGDGPGGGGDMDSGSSVGRDMTGCMPTTCASVNATCGFYPDGCGKILNCYPDGRSCGPGNSNGTCAGGGQAYTCGKKGQCTALKQCPAGVCGVIIPDKCSNVIICPACP